MALLIRQEKAATIHLSCFSSLTVFFSFVDPVLSQSTFSSSPLEVMLVIGLLANAPTPRISQTASERSLNLSGPLHDTYEVLLFETTLHEKHNSSDKGWWSLFLCAQK